MISNQEKTEFLHSFIEKMQRQEDEDIIKSDIHRLLLQDTGDGKLYKYRAFNDYSFNNLRTQTLHGSKLSMFNDPFDGRLGVDIHSLVEAKFNLEFAAIEEVLLEFVKVNNGRMELADYNTKNKPIIKKLMNNNQLCDFFNNTHGLSDEAAVKYLFDHFDIIIGIMSSVAADEKTGKKMELTTKAVPELIKYITPEGQLKLPEAMFSYESFIRSMGIEDDADEISLVKSYYMKQKPDDRNTALKMEQSFSDIGSRINQVIDNNQYIICLCADNKNRLMWSHYADNHKGFCIEYDFDLHNLENNFVYPVIYSAMRPKIPWEIFITANNTDNQEVNKNLLPYLLLLLLTKDEVWSYEREWRILVPSANKVMDIEAPPISCIYLGALCSEENQKCILSIAKQLDVPVKKMVIDRGEYNLHVESID